MSLVNFFSDGTKIKELSEVWVLSYELETSSNMRSGKDGLDSWVFFITFLALAVTSVPSDELHIVGYNVTTVTGINLLAWAHCYLQSHGRLCGSSDFVLTACLFQTKGDLIHLLSSLSMLMMFLLLLIICNNSTLSGSEQLKSPPAWDNTWLAMSRLNILQCDIGCTPTWQDQHLNC